MNKDLLTKDELARERLDTMARVFTKADRVLSGQEVICRVVDEELNQAPAWSNGEEITFNAALIGNVASIEDIIKVTGLNYHELAHNLYTPRSHTSIYKKVKAEGLFQSFNILEDQRIETLLTAVYMSVAPYFVTTFMRFCAAHEEQWNTNFILSHGRRYLPANVRAEFRKRFISPKHIGPIAKVIDEYRSLTFPTDYDRAFDFIKEFDRLCQEAMPTPPMDPHGHVAGVRPDISQGKPVGVAEQRETSEAAQENEEDDEENVVSGMGDNQGQQDDDDSDDNGDDTGSEEDEGDSDGSGGGDDDQEGDSEEESDEGSAGGEGIDGSSDGDGDSQGSSGGSGFGESGAPSSESNKNAKGGTKGGKSEAPKMTDEELRDLMNQTADDAEQAPEVQEDAKTKQDSITRSGEQITQHLPASSYTEVPISADGTLVTKKFARELEQLRDDLDPGWNRRQSSGRVNIQRYIQGDDFDSIWDRWDEGHTDNTDVEAVVLIDISDSMRNRIAMASEAMWIIKRALESIDANVTVLSYNEEAFRVYDREEKVNRTAFRLIGCRGGTDPYIALQDSLRVFHNTRRHNKLLILITDGGWNDDQTSDDNADGIIRRLNNHGIVTSMVFLAYTGYDPDTYPVPAHHCQVTKAISDPRDLADFARQTVKQMMLGSTRDKSRKRV